MPGVSSFLPGVLFSVVPFDCSQDLINTLAALKLSRLEGRAGVASGLFGGVSSRLRAFSTGLEARDRAGYVVKEPAEDHAGAG